MGYFSDKMIHEAEQRLRLRGLEGKKVCSNCFADPHLSRLIDENADADACDYCGDQGEDVKKLQAALGLTADGDFGPVTKAAVVALQKKKGLYADGIVGKQTWAVLDLD